MQPQIYSKCPFCKETALVSHEPIMGELPDTIYEVICKTCGQFCILSRLLPENLAKDDPMAKYKDKDFDTETIYNHNKSALTGGKMMIWIDSKENAVLWDQAIEGLSDPLPIAYAVKDFTNFLKEN